MGNTVLPPVRLVAGKLKTGGGWEPPRVLEHGATLYWPQYGIAHTGGGMGHSCAPVHRGVGLGAEAN
jgi:hypothetical protein